MLSEYEAAVLAREKGLDPARGQAAPGRNRIGAVLLALSVLSAVGLLYSAFFHRGPVASATRVDPAATSTTHIIHPGASGHPEAALFLRHRPLEHGARATDAVQTTADMAASAR
jgi:hypothetical protein